MFYIFVMVRITKLNEFCVNNVYDKSLLQTINGIGGYTFDLMTSLLCSLVLFTIVLVMFCNLHHECSSIRIYLHTLVLCVSSPENIGFDFSQIMGNTKI